LYIRTVGKKKHGKGRKKTPKEQVSMGMNSLSHDRRKGHSRKTPPYQTKQKKRNLKKKTAKGVKGPT